MNKKPTTPFQASFWLTPQEQIYLLIICALFLVGILARYFYLKTEPVTCYTSTHIETIEPTHD